MRLRCLSGVVVLSVLAFMVGCGGSQKLLAVKEFKKVAVIAITADKTIDWRSEGEGEDGNSVQSTVKFIGALSKGKSLSEAATEAKHNAKTALDLCAKDVYVKIVESKVLKVVSEEEVQSNGEYQALVDDKIWAGSRIAADGYKVLDDDEEVRAKLCKALGVDGLVTVHISFQKGIFTGVGGSGQAKATSIVFAKVYDAAGEVIWHEQNTELSENSTAMIAGAYKFDEMDKMAAQAAVTATGLCMEKLQKELDKAQK